MECFERLTRRASSHIHAAVAVLTGLCFEDAARLSDKLDATRIASDAERDTPTGAFHGLASATAALLVSHAQGYLFNHHITSVETAAARTGHRWRTLRQVPDVPDGASFTITPVMNHASVSAPLWQVLSAVFSQSLDFRRVPTPSVGARDHALFSAQYHVAAACVILEQDGVTSPILVGAICFAHVTVATAPKSNLVFLHSLAVIPEFQVIRDPNRVLNESRCNADSYFRARFQCIDRIAKSRPS
jgi:hypothetical protein